MSMTLKETIRYVSTRRVSSTSTTDNTNTDSVTFEEAILQGYAPDGGLFVPERLPTISTQELLLWASFSYTQLTFQVLRKFISLDEIPDDALLQICTEAFQKDWYHKDVIPVIPLITSAVVDEEEEEEEEEGSSSSQDNNNNYNNNTNILYVSELFHGPTHCFKDLGMIMMILLLQYFATKRQKTITLLVSTTGDTGPAAVHAVRRLTGSTTASWNTNNNTAEDTSPIKVIVHYPKGQISKFQRLQLTTQICHPQVTVVSFEGGGDDMDVPIKNILTEQRQKLNNNNNNNDECNQHCCTGVNSYNIARPIMQAVHYIWTYLRVVEKHGSVGDPELKVNFVIPTGAMGNIAGGYMAKLMGVPIGMLCAGVNVNDITHRVFQTGKFHKSSNMKKTLSDAINVQIPYNFERLLYYLANEDPHQVRMWMNKVDTTDKLDLDTEWVERLHKEFRSARVDDQEMCQTLLEVREKYGYIADPHTAVALAAAKNLGYFGHRPSASVCLSAVLATASPCKFQESVTEAIGEEGWQNYFNSNDFPAHGKVTLALEEKPVLEYIWRQGADLNTVQAEWEISLRKLIANLSTSKGPI